jgi:tetratricopeptide (TPR) repeat protein
VSLRKVRCLVRGTGGGQVRGLLTVLVVLACVASWFAIPGCADRMSEARSLEERGDLAGSLALYAQIIEDDPNRQAAIEDAAVRFFRMGCFDEALVLEEKLAAVDPKNAQIRVELGFNYLNYQDRAADAVRVLTEAAEIQPTAKFLCFLSQAHSAAGDTRLAEQDLNHAIQTDPGYVHSYQLMVALLEDQGRTGEAQEVVKQASSEGVAFTRLP